MKLNKKISRLLLTSLLSTSFIFNGVQKASAENGFIPHYVGLEGLVAGAGTALPLDAIGVITNPSFLAMLPSHIIAMAGISHKDQYVNMTGVGLANSAAGKQKNQYLNRPLMDLALIIGLTIVGQLGLALQAEVDSLNSQSLSPLRVARQTMTQKQLIG